MEGIMNSLSLPSPNGGLRDRYDSESAADRSKNPAGGGGVCAEYLRGAAALKSNCGILGGEPVAEEDMEALVGT